MTSVFIYALKCPDTGLVEYVGKSKNLQQRLKNHKSECRKEKHLRANWIKSLGLGSMAPTLVILDEVPESEWQQWEVAYIEYFKGLGLAKKNGTSGGDGVGGGENHPFYGKKLSFEHRTNIGIGQLGNRRSDDTRDKQRALKLGKPLSEIHRMNLSLASINKKKRCNTSGFLGAAWDKSRLKWLSYTRIIGQKKKHIGRFTKLEDAVFARNLWLDLYGGMA